MAEELEAGALAALEGGSGRMGNPVEPGTPCRNCRTPVVGRFCSECGQLAQSFHRPIWGLFSEVVGDFFSLDGRVMRTIPSLVFRPGKVTRTYLDGKRQRFVPPFRLYLLTSFIFFLMLFGFAGSKGWLDVHYITPEQAAAAMLREGSAGDEIERSVDLATERLEKAGLPSGVNGQGKPVSATVEAPRAETTEVDDKPLILPNGQIDRKRLREIFSFQDDASGKDNIATLHIVDKIADAYENQGMFFASIQNWAPRVALAFTPALTLLLLMVYPFRRKIFVYDHIIASMHIQSWLYILLGIGLIFFWFGQSWFAFVLFIAPPVYLYRMFRVVYESGRVFSVLRTLFILISLTTLILILLVVLLALGVADTAPTIRSLSQN